MSSKSISTGAVLLLSLFFFVFGCNNRQGQQGQEGRDTTADAEEMLIQVDCDFAAMALDSGLAVAFDRFAADSAVLLRQMQMPFIGREAIRGLFAKGSHGLLQWEPQFADVSGELGYTFGHYQFNPGDTTIGGIRQGTGATSRGYYVTIWKRINGDWKYVLDTGVSGPKEVSEIQITKPGESDKGDSKTDSAGK